MKIRSNTLRLLLATATLGALASLASAGPGIEYWQRGKHVTTFTEAKAAAPDALVTMKCDHCKTVMIHDTKRVGPPAKGSERPLWFTVGSKHTCDECKGEITVVKGKTEDSMQHDCSTCGEASVTCCIVAAVKP